MNEEMFFELIGYADDKFLAQCEKKHKRLLKTPKWFNMIAGVALAYIVIMPLINLTFHPLILNQGTKTVTSFSSTQTPDDHHFGYYEGPLLPLTTTLENTDDISVSRDILIDFSRYDNYEYSFTDALLTDTYTLTNHSDKVKTFDIYYPYCVYDLNQMEYQKPSVTLNDKTIYPDIHVGKYTPNSYLKPNYDGYDEFNISSLNNYNEYISLLSDGTYLKDTLSDFNALSDISVIEYTFSNHFHLNYDSDGTFYAECNLDKEKSGFLNDEYINHFERIDNKTVRFGIAGSYADHSPAHLYILGDDIDHISFTDGLGNPLEDSDVTVTRTERNLEDIIFAYALTNYSYVRKDPAQSIAEITNAHFLSFDEYFKLYCECIDYIITNPDIYEKIDEQYFMISLDLMGDDLMRTNVVCYLSTNITLNAGEMATIRFNSKKYASNNCKTLKYTGNYSSTAYYDLLTDTGSNFSFTEITSSMINYKNIDIIKQNLGFQIKKKVTDVSLDTKNTHYYMIIRNKRYYNKYRHHWYDWWTIPKY